MLTKDVLDLNLRWLAKQMGVQVVQIKILVQVVKLRKKIQRLMKFKRSWQTSKRSC